MQALSPHIGEAAHIGGKKKKGGPQPCSNPDTRAADHIASGQPLPAAGSKPLSTRARESGWLALADPNPCISPLLLLPQHSSLPPGLASPSPRLFETHLAGVTPKPYPPPPLCSGPDVNHACERGAGRNR